LRAEARPFRIAFLRRSDRLSATPDRSSHFEKLCGTLVVGRPVRGEITLFRRFGAAARTNAQRLLVASMILLRPAALSFRFGFWAAGAEAWAAAPDSFFASAHLFRCASAIWRGGRCQQRSSGLRWVPDHFSGFRRFLKSLAAIAPPSLNKRVSKCF